MDFKKKAENLAVYLTQHTQGKIEESIQRDIEQALKEAWNEG